MMRLTTLVLGLCSALAAGQLLNDGHGTLPTCGDSCAILTAAQTACASSWSCFCQNVWTASGEDPATMCNTACTDPTDQVAVNTWYTANCGSDNGASEHPGTPSATPSPTSPTSTSSAGGAGGAGADAGSSSSGGGCTGSYVHCHGWVIAVIVIIILLILLGVAALWYKRRRDRRRDQNSAPFNSGVTAHAYDEKAGAAPFEAGSGSESSARTRDAFMPYGYGYTRSESRNDDGPVITRGGTPFEEMEKGDAPYPSVPESGMRNKMRRVMVREKSLK